MYVIGDIHGEWDRLTEIVKNLERDSNKLTLLVAGDFGIWSTLNIEDLIRCATSFKDTTRVYFVDGNHENYDLLYGFPVTERAEGLVREITPQIFHLQRGHFYNIGGKSILAFGGAASIDKDYRIPGVSWWAEEEWTEKDEVRVGELINNGPQQVDIILTHEGPASGVTQILPHIGPLGAWMRKGLDFIEDTFDYEMWFFGHYHQDIELEREKEGRMYCVYKNPLEIL